ncbi:general transcription factor II-I repeat domain-containing protein 2-like [Octopus sinensis]|uniref:General transcription factor II-I repeat domain-containing protein 2-like n=1 Tax=Octopus sinensis TaxID=2607531 RepID=A0A6P7U0S7_9MOLL|nr:general transcription factor II-I repeat domain-containing protein 2-like [Octopus sinensis]
MSFSTKRKVDTECRSFQKKWKLEYFFADLNRKPTCLVCRQEISVVKEYNIRRHYQTHHAHEYNNLMGKIRKEKYDALLACLRNQQSSFSKFRDDSEAAVKASYVISREIALASKPYFYKNMYYESY